VCAMPHRGYLHALRNGPPRLVAGPPSRGALRCGLSRPHFGHGL